MASYYDEVMKAKSFLPLQVVHLPEEVVEKARRELNETEETRASAIAELRELVIGEKNLHCQTDDKFLLEYLRPRKFDVKSAFQLLRNFFKHKKAFPECFESCDLESLMSFFRAGSIACLPYRDTNGCAIILFEMDKWIPDEHDFITVLRASAMVMKFSIDNPVSQICGVQVIINVQGTTFQNLRSSFSPRYIRFFASALRNSVPWRIKGIHIYNESRIFRYMWSIVKLFLSEKVRQRVHFHGDDAQRLHEFVPKDILPKDYGGDNEYFDMGEWCQTHMKSFYEKFVTAVRSGYVEKK